MKKAPVISSVDPKNWGPFSAYMDSLRVKNTLVAREEAERLGPYFEVLAEQLQTDMAISWTDHPVARRLATPGNLAKVFNAVAEESRNTILSDIVVIPESLLETNLLEGTQSFIRKSVYGNCSFSFGFVQVSDQGGSRTSNSFPILALDTDMMTAIDGFQPEALLGYFQDIMNAGNHDMLHQFQNTILPDSVSKTPVADLRFAMLKWGHHYFGSNSTRSPESIESWTVMTHANVRHILEERDGGKTLQDLCDRYFDELARIGEEIEKSASRQDAHKVVDYFGTMFCFSMIRFVPLDHPLMDRALQRMEQIDPDHDALLKETRAALADLPVLHEEDGVDYFGPMVENYRANGLELLPDNPDYAAMKKTQLAATFAALVRILSPATREDETLLKAKTRAAKVHSDMVVALAESLGFQEDGTRQAKPPPIPRPDLL